jgi:hypothetical protein
MIYFSNLDDYLNLENMGYQSPQPKTKSQEGTEWEDLRVY